MYGLRCVQGELYGGVWYVRSESEECKVRNVRSRAGARYECVRDEVRTGRGVYGIRNMKY